MRQIVFVFLLMVIVFIAFTAEGLAVDVNQLVEKSKFYDGKEVVFKGEVVGDIMVRGDYAWINVFDGANAMGIWIKTSEARKIERTGDYKNKGDIVETRGIFNRACKEHGGDTDIHGESLIIKKRGRQLAHPVSFLKIFTAIGLAVLSEAAFLFDRHIQRKRLAEDSFTS
ncbi:MAG: DNA-binding protein [Actinobacteria bacterium]|nr:DNA-binding protein [Actinomycetota bacterium]